MAGSIGENVTRIAPFCNKRKLRIALPIILCYIEPGAPGRSIVRKSADCAQLPSHSESSMSDFCKKIESVSEGIKPGANPETAAPLLEALAEFNKSHILGSDLLKNANQTAKQMHEKGVYGEKAATGLPGSSGWIQQSDGKPNALEIVEGDRTESMRLDKNGEPVLNIVSQSCDSGKKSIQSAFFIKDGKQVLSSVSIVPDLEIIVDQTGKPQKIKSY